MNPPSAATIKASEVESERDEFVLNIDSIEQVVKDIREKFGELVDAHNESWNFFQRNLNPFKRGRHDDQQDAIEDMKHNVYERRFEDEEPDGGVVGSIINVADTIVNHHHPVVSLFLTSMDWADKTMEDTTDVFAEIWQPKDGRKLAQWDGEARDAYDHIREQQLNSVAAAANIADGLSAWLADIAVDNVEYVAFLLQQLGSVLEKIVEALGLVANSVGAAVIWGVAKVVAGLVKEAITHLATIFQNIARMFSRVIEAERLLSDHSYFPDGAWPEAVTRS